MNYLIPEKIESDRLTLRTFKETDWKDLYEYYSDVETTKYTSGKILSEGETWRVMASMIGHWSIKGYGPYALEEKEKGKIIGISGLWYPNDWPEPEIKWGLNRSYHGKGYATEAARRVQLIAKEYLPETSLISLIHSKNEPSIRLAVTLGCSFEKEIVFRGDFWRIYRHI